MSEEKEKKHRKLSLSKKKMISGYLFILPWILGFLFFYVRSIFMTVQFSFSDLKMDAINGGYTLKFVGLQNYIYAFREHPTFKEILTTSVMDMLIDVPLITFFSLFLAMLLNKPFKGRSIVRAIFFLPIILNAGAVTDAIKVAETMIAGGVSAQAQETAMVSSALSFDIDYLISRFVDLGVPVSLIGYISQAVARINAIISASSVQIIIFIAALQSIPSSMYEVAKIEGATNYETFWKVTFPMVMPHIITNVVYTIVDSFTESEVVELAKTTSFDSFKYGLGSVFCLVSTIVTCLVLVLVCRFIQKRTFYYN